MHAGRFGILPYSFGNLGSIIKNQTRNTWKSISNKINSKFQKYQTDDPYSSSLNNYNNFVRGLENSFINSFGVKLDNYVAEYAKFLYHKTVSFENRALTKATELGLMEQSPEKTTSTKSGTWKRRAEALCSTTFLASAALLGATIVNHNLGDNSSIVQEAYAYDAYPCIYLDPWTPPDNIGGWSLYYYGDTLDALKDAVSNLYGSTEGYFAQGSYYRDRDLPLAIADDNLMQAKGRYSCIDNPGYSAFDEDLSAVFNSLSNVTSLAEIKNYEKSTGQDHPSVQLLQSIIEKVERQRDNLIQANPIPIIVSDACKTRFPLDKDTPENITIDLYKNLSKDLDVAKQFAKQSVPFAENGQYMDKTMNIALNAMNDQVCLSETIPQYHNSTIQKNVGELYSSAEMGDHRISDTLRIIDHTKSMIKAEIIRMGGENNILIENQPLPANATQTNNSTPHLGPREQRAANQNQSNATQFDFSGIGSLPLLETAPYIGAAGVGIGIGIGVGVALARRSDKMNPIREMKTDIINLIKKLKDNEDHNSS